MARTTDLERPNAPKRGPAGSSLAVAGDRGTHAKRARHHSVKVRLLKGLLPLAAICVIAGYAGAVLKTVGWGDVVPTVALPKILPEHLAIKDPVYEGFDEDGGRYVVRSETAQQDLANRNRIALIGITGELVDASKSNEPQGGARQVRWPRQPAGLDGIEVDADSGLSARLATALVCARRPVPGSVSVVPSGTVTAEGDDPAPKAARDHLRSAWWRASGRRRPRRVPRGAPRPARPGGCPAPPTSPSTSRRTGSTWRMQPSSPSSRAMSPRCRARRG
jgi:hypothetical protein